MTFLIVQADPAVQRVAREILESAGVVCIVGDDGAEAADLVRVGQPDVVLVGIGPSLAGIETVQAIRGVRPEAKVVLLAAHDEDAYLSSTGRSGADALVRTRELGETLLPTLRGLGWEFVGIWDGKERRDGWLAGPASRNRRSETRYELALPVRVRARGGTDAAWEEATRGIDVSYKGASFPLTHGVRRGEVLHLLMPLPKRFRRHDAAGAAYDVYALVRDLVPRGDGARVGVLFFGREPRRPS